MKCRVLEMMSQRVTFLCEVTWSQSGLWLVDRYLRHSVTASSGVSSSPVRFYPSGQIFDQSHHYWSITNQLQLMATLPVLFTNWLIDCTDDLISLGWSVSSVGAVWWWPLTSGSISWSMKRRRSNSWRRGFTRLRPQDWWSTQTASRSQVTQWGHCCL